MLENREEPWNQAIAETPPSISQADDLRNGVDKIIGDDELDDLRELDRQLRLRNVTPHLSSRVDRPQLIQAIAAQFVGLTKTANKTARGRDDA